MALTSGLGHDDDTAPVHDGGVEGEQGGFLPAMHVLADVIAETALLASPPLLQTPPSVSMKARIWLAMMPKRVGAEIR